MPKITRTVAPGDRFGRGVVIEEIRIPIPSRPRGRRGARLLCDCGKTYEALIGNLAGRRPVQSCGCLAIEVQRAHGSSQATLDRLAEYARSPEGRTRSSAAGKRRITHGLSRHDGTQHPLYQTWSNMMTRCYNPRYRQYIDYGGRDITVWEPWHDAAVFIADIGRLLGPKPPDMTLDRIDNDGNYEPGNVRWATRVQQARNSRKFAV
jgi:hypothetical protein